MTPPPFPIAWRNLFIETAFEKRFQALLRSAWQKRTWHVIVAEPGSGKTTVERAEVQAYGVAGPVRSPVPGL